MPTPTYVALATTTLGSAASSVTFSSIPATYRDLVLVMNVKFTGSIGEIIRININGDSTAANYPIVDALGTGSSTQSNTDNRRFGYLGDEESAITAHFMDYSDTSKHKTFLTRSGGAGYRTAMTAGRWANTDAITTIQLSLDSGNYDAASVISLYGIEA